MGSELHMRARMQQGMKRAAAEAGGALPEARVRPSGGGGLRAEGEAVPMAAGTTAEPTTKRVGRPAAVAKPAATAKPAAAAKPGAAKSAAAKPPAAAAAAAASESVEAAEGATGSYSEAALAAGLKATDPTVRAAARKAAAAAAVAWAAAADTVHSPDEESHGAAGTAAFAGWANGRSGDLSGSESTTTFGAPRSPGTGTAFASGGFRFSRDLLPEGAEAPPARGAGEDGREDDREDGEELSEEEDEEDEDDDDVGFSTSASPSEAEEDEDDLPAGATAANMQSGMRGASPPGIVPVGVPGVPGLVTGLSRAQREAQRAKLVARLALSETSPPVEAPRPRRAAPPPAPLPAGESDTEEGSHAEATRGQREAQVAAEREGGLVFFSDDEQ